MAQFTAIRNESLWNRFVWRLRCSWAWLQGDTFSPYFAHRRDSNLSNYGSLLLEYVTSGRPLSSTWRQYRQDKNRCTNLYRSISNILLDLAKVSHPRIGSWTMDNRGVISLTNRPLLDLTMLWNRHSIPVPVPKVPRYQILAIYLLAMLNSRQNMTFPRRIHLLSACSRTKTTACDIN